MSRGPIENGMAVPPRIRGNVVGFRVKKKDPIVGLGPLKKAATYFPTDVVSSAQTGLTSLFGMVRGEPRRYNHLNFSIPAKAGISVEYP